MPTHRPAPDTPTRTLTLRDPQAGDWGWLIQQHGLIYAREYGWNHQFEALVADIVAQVVRNFQPDVERCWVAELDGQKVGSITLVRKTDEQAQLRLLILTPEARGLGLGSRLVDECLAFARAVGYRSVMLWTNSCLTAARSMYAKRGFVLTHSEPYHDFGQDLISETWECTL